MLGVKVLLLLVALLFLAGAVLTRGRSHWLPLFAIACLWLVLMLHVWPE